MRAIPTSLVVGAANISFPALSTLVGYVDDIVPFIGSVAKALLAVVIIRIIAAIIALIASTFGTFDGAARLPIIVNMLAFATLANVSLLVGATVITALIVGESASVRSLGQAIGLDLGFGTSFLIIEWAAAASSVVGTLYWLSVWFVDYRESSFSRTSRHPARIGDWYGIWDELVSDWRGPLRETQEQTDKEALIVPDSTEETNGGRPEGFWI